MAVEGNYIKQDDVDNWPEDVTQTEMKEIIDRIEEDVERIIGDYFYPKTFHLLIDGSGKGQVFPKFKSKILSINKMAIDEVGVSTIDLTGANISGSSGAYTVTLTKTRVAADYYEDDYLGIYDISESVETNSTASGNCYWGSRIIGNTATSTGGTSAFTIEKPLPITLSTGGDIVSIITNWDWGENSIYRNKPVTISEPTVLNEPSEFYWGGKFPKGSRNIEVWGSKGWYSCPKQIKQAVVVLCRYENDNTLYGSYNQGMKSEKLGDYSYTRSDPQISGKSLTGVSEADRLLSRYIRRKPILGVP